MYIPPFYVTLIKSLMSHGSGLSSQGSEAAVALLVSGETSTAQRGPLGGGEGEERHKPTEALSHDDIGNYVAS